ncbi:putative OPA3-like protein CG13603 isoform X2 [Eupeodes corollae]|uniref:putative OPA3-like protein CG13603 isoform X2 n=1 Tax=Eupeodes corollae TaxID=290404 RepID=UPI00248FCACE|nr:putative OPA3-like protein CG13603 isoform X2 [Eupeodes corollae]
MVVGAFPAAKLGVLAIKQISKPIANVIKNSAKNSPFFRKYVCMPPAQMYNWMEVKYKMWVMNLGKPANIPQLTEPMAIELGANLLGEFIIFTIGAGVLIVEYVRSANKEAKKEAAAKQEQLELALTISELGFRIEKQDAQIREMTRILADLDSRSFFKFGIKDHKREIEALPLNLVSNDNSQVFLARDLEARATAA